MKLSNKILIAFFGFIFIYMAAAFTELRISGNPTTLNDSIGIAEVVDITGVTYLILPDLEESVTIKGSSEKARIEVLSLSGDMLHNLSYRISGDTLTLVSLDIQDDTAINIFIYVPKNSLKGLTANGAGVIMEDFNQNSLSITQKNGWVRMKETNLLKNLSVMATEDAYLDLEGFNLDTLSVVLDNSRVNLHSTTKRANGLLYNDSYLQLGEVNEIEFKKDSTSVLRIY